MNVRDEGNIIKRVKGTKSTHGTFECYKRGRKCIKDIYWAALNIKRRHQETQL